MVVAPTPPTEVAFRFDAIEHEYIDLATGETIDHITGLLEVSGWTDSTYCTEESRVRGTKVHRMTADYDLDALDPKTAEGSPYVGWLHAHVACREVAKPTIHEVELPRVHPQYRFGGRPDREVTAWGRIATWEIKSGPAEKGHQIQTALQAILIAPVYHLPPRSIARFAEYLTREGRWKVDEHKNQKDFDAAYAILRKYCR